MEPHQLNRISFLTIQSAIQVHRVLGPGLLESTYRTYIIYELRERGLNVVAEQLVPIRYGPLIFEGGYRLDLLVEDQVLVELKAGKPLGLLINFNVPVLVDGVTRKMNGCPEAALDSTRRLAQEAQRENTKDANTRP